MNMPRLTRTEKISFVIVIIGIIAVLLFYISDVKQTRSVNELILSQQTRNQRIDSTLKTSRARNIHMAEQIDSMRKEMKAIHKYLLAE